MRGVRRSTPTSRVESIHGSGSWKRTSTTTEHAEHQRVTMAVEQSERSGAGGCAREGRLTNTKEHSVILMLLVVAVDNARIPDRRCRYTLRSEALTSDCC